MAPSIINTLPTLVKRMNNCSPFIHLSKDYGQISSKNDETASSQMPKIVRVPVLQRQMTSLGRFALHSQTVENPSIITFFVALAHEMEEDFTAKDFRSVWGERVMGYHERFRCQVSKDDDRFFEITNRPLDEYIVETDHPAEKETDLLPRIESMAMSSLDVTNRLWEASVSSGPLGSSGAIPKEYISDLTSKDRRETLAMFRVHHSLCDGMSIAVVVGDATDEAGRLRDIVGSELQKRMARHGGYFFLMSLVRSFLLILACIYSFGHQLWKMVTSNNAFGPVLKRSKIPAGRRSIAWRHVSSLENVKRIGKEVSHKTTINDIAVAMVSHAIKKQLKYHAMQLDGEVTVHIPKHVNLTIPVHLTGGILRPGDQLGNKVGGFVTSIPLNAPEGGSSRDRVSHISRKLHREKMLPAPMISWVLAKLCSDFAPDWISKLALRKFNANSVAVVSNIKGFPFGVHWLGRKVSFISAFLPLPPGIPIGVVVQSYDGNISLGINADMRVVPDAEKFADWMLAEFEIISQK